MKNQKHLLSGLALIIFSVFALASRVNKIHYGAFNYSNSVEDPAETQNYLLKDDGTKVYGDKISWKSGLIFKDQIKIDDQKFKIKEVRGYLQKGVFYGRLRSTYIKRIVHGKINVYVEFTDVTTTSTDHSGFTHTSSYVRTDQYSQQGDTGPMVTMASQSDIEQLVSSCPLAVELAHKSNHQIRKAIRKDRNYLNEIFDVYNSGCKPVNGAE
jgi:hypothetical protein